jgi:pyruvate formate lyase activating enzyme
MKIFKNSKFLRESLLYETLGEGKVQCNVCQRRCVIASGHAGFCKTRLNIDSILYTLIYGLCAAVHADPIEKKPVFHYYPGSRCFSLGTVGCNFRCDFCQNWDISFVDATKINFSEIKFLSPQEAVNMAYEEHCKGISWTYNEPTIWLEYTLDCMKVAKKNTPRDLSSEQQKASIPETLYTVYVTNGFATREALDVIGPYLDVWRVDIKSMNDKFYQKFIGISSMKGILEVTKYAKEKWKMHVECVTNVVPGWNDNEEDFDTISKWIVENLGEETPWHVTRFFPHAEVTDIPPTPIEALEYAIKIGKKNGLKHVFPGNVLELDENTYCKSCNKLLIKRHGYSVRIVGVGKDGRCKFCNTKNDIVIGQLD